MSIQDEEQRLAAEADENMAAWEAGIERLEDELRARHPELFDASGEFRAEEAMRQLKQYASENGLTFKELYFRAGENFRRRANASQAL
jgi:hypothetical protein